MAEDYLEEIYQYSNVVTTFRQIVEYFRVDDWHHANYLLKESEQLVRNACADCIASDYPEGKEIWQFVSDAYLSQDMTMRADIIEGTVIPRMETWIQSLGCVTQQMDEKYQIESTASGFLTMKYIQDDAYLHSNNDPMDEARKRVEYFFVPSVERYAVLGCGLGYHVYQIYRQSHGSVKILLFETDKRVVEYAKNYGVLDWIPEENLEICTKNSIERFLQAVDNNQTGAYMHVPFLFHIENEVEKNAMLQAFGEFHTPYIFKKDLQINFYRNVNSGAKPINDLPKSRIGDEVVIVAAGPSLDDTLDFLRRVKGKKTILAVGTVFKKLVKLGIYPDFVVIMDPQERTLKQLDGVENEEVPMLFDVGSYWGFARRYKGEKYFILTASIYEVMTYAQENKIDVWPSGGTVTSLALEVAIQYNVKSIYFVGVDLAYPGGLSHAADTMDRTQKDISDMIEIPGVRGKRVHTTQVFGIYLRWIQDRIADNPQIKWYNLSQVGARIEGAKEIDADSICSEPEKMDVDGKISVIVPCYNVEKYISSCIESLLNQTIGQENLELIFVDDASTDGTFDILQQYAEKNDQCMKVFQLPQNSRQGAARNVGLKIAEGDYIGFADADDYVEKEMYELLYRALKSADADVAICGRFDEYPNGKVEYSGPEQAGIVYVNKMQHSVIELNQIAPSGVVQRLYKRAFLEKVNVQFPENITYEDNYFIGVSNYYLETVGLVNRPLYHYRINTDSTVQKKNSLHHLDRLKVEIMLIEELKKREIFSKNKEEIEARFMEMYFVNTVWILFKRFDELPEGILKKMQENVNNYFPDWRKNLFLQSYKEGNVRKICELADYPFKKGNKEELSEALKEVF